MLTREGRGSEIDWGGVLGHLLAFNENIRLRRLREPRTPDRGSFWANRIRYMNPSSPVNRFTSTTVPI